MRGWAGSARGRDSGFWFPVGPLSTTALTQVPSLPVVPSARRRGPGVGPLASSRPGPFQTQGQWRPEPAGLAASLGMKGPSRPCPCPSALPPRRAQVGAGGGRAGSSRPRREPGSPRARRPGRWVPARTSVCSPAPPRGAGVQLGRRSPALGPRSGWCRNGAGGAPHGVERALFAVETEGKGARWLVRETQQGDAAAPHRAPGTCAFLLSQVRPGSRPDDRKDKRNKGFLRPRRGRKARWAQAAGSRGPTAAPHERGGARSAGKDGVL